MGTPEAISPMELNREEAINTAEEETVEDFEKRQKEPYVEFLLLRALKVNEGNEGIICEVDVSNIDPDVLKGITVDIDTEHIDNNLAVKLIKISPKDAEAIPRILEEANHQEYAHELLSKRANETGEEYAAVPKIYFSDSITVTSPELRERLVRYGIQIRETNKVEVLFMDYIQGDDFAVYLYKEAIKRLPELKDLQHAIEEGSEIPLHMYVERLSDALHIPMPTNEIFAFNKSVIDFLAKTDFVLDKKFYDTTRKSIEELNKHELYHNDLHARNIMLMPTDDGFQSYIIDFGKATRKNLEIHERRKLGYLDDSHWAISFEPLTHTADEREALMEDELFSRSKKLLERKNKIEYDAFRDHISNRVATSKITSAELNTEIDTFLNSLGVELQRSPVMDDLFWNMKAYILKTFSHEYPKLHEAIQRYIEEIDAPLSAKNLLRKIKPARE